jgi:hypothetical protein
LGTFPPPPLDGSGLLLALLALLTTPSGVGTIANIVATLVTRFKDITPEGGVIELVVWALPKPVPPCTHSFKYRAAYAVGGKRIVGFDNERGKGDHRHIGGREEPYRFVSVDQLVEDFIAAVEAARRQT